jgi:hypothetical protein
MIREIRIVLIKEIIYLPYKHLITMTKEWSNPVGRPQVLTEEQIQKVMEDLLDYIINNEDPTIVWFTSSYPGIDSESLWRKYYINKDYISDHEEFSELRKLAIEKQEAYLVKNGTKWITNATMSIFRLKQPQHWYTDRLQVENRNLNYEMSEEEENEMDALIDENV